MSLTTQNNLLEALQQYTNTPVEIVYEVFYNPVTRECISKSCDGTHKSETSIVVTKEEYDKIDFCPNFFIRDGGIYKKQLSVANKTILVKKNTGYKAMKDNNVFAVDENDFSTAVDYWCVRSWDD